MLSRWSQESEYALNELGFAKRKKKKIVLVNIDGCTMIDDFDFHYGGRDIIQWNDTPQREKLLRNIARWIGDKGESKEVQSSSAKIVLPAEEASFNVNGALFKVVWVEGGTFTKGATSEQGSDADDDEKPTHGVTLSGYYIGETLVTQALWKAVMGDNPSRWKDDCLPVERVSWNDTQEFIKKLNNMTGRTFRLPTEAEWEYAARGGSKSQGCKYSGGNNVDEVAWYFNNSGRKTHPVKQKRANELGLYDMSGNVWEWCGDWYGDYGSGSQTNPKGLSTGSNRVVRGGSWFSLAKRCRVSNRRGNAPLHRGNYRGLRLVLVP